jgi:UDP-glucuronate decarboxylase
MRVAVVTPYFRERDDVLRQCLDSVAAQTYPVAHILVADGFPSDWASRAVSHHIVLPGTGHADNGNLGRAIGSAIAVTEGFDAIALLDADNWYRPDHISSLLSLHQQTGAALCTASRSLHRMDGSLLAAHDRESDGARFADTSCLLYLREAFALLTLWGQMPRQFGPICDRIIMQHDVTVPLHVEVHQIYNLACPASPVQYQFDPVQTTKTSVQGAINMLELAKKVKARIFQASTSEIYGDPEIHPQVESYWGRVNPVGIRSCYDEGKRCAETLFFDYWRQYQLSIKVARIFNTYGPRMHPNDGRVVSNFIMQALRGDDITIYGTGQQTRSFCYVSDLIVAIVRMMATPQAFTGPVNIGNPAEFTMLELAEKVISLTGSKSKLVFTPLPSDDPRQRQPDIDLARKELSWEPEVSLIDGLKETITFFRKNYY